MTLPVETLPNAKRRIRQEAEWREREHGAESARRWFEAVDEAIASLAGSHGHALCLDPAVQGRGLREKYFGAGGADTHRLIFRVAGPAVEVLTVRGFAQDDLTPRDL